MLLSTGEWGRLEFFRAYVAGMSAPQRGALCDYATSWHAPRSGGRKAPRGLIPLGFPRCEKVATLPLCSSFRKNIRFQRLRGQVKETCPHCKAKVFAFLACHAWWQALRQSTTKVHLTSLITLCSVAMPRGFPGGTPGRLFFRHFFATRQRNGIKATRERVPKAQCERPEE